ncbi:hypothetical protein ABZV80_44730 [Streptomyces sp. NPDC005132]|uniref:hypothetical protein n=1 Tax=Streptomyces sp. NPDC005132 TaxID=3154294 RepID=UPI0033B155EF
MPVDTGGLLADATAEAGRGLAPLTAAAAVGGLGARLGVKGAGWLLIGRRPDGAHLAKWRKPTAGGDPEGGGPLDGGPSGSGPGGPRRPGGPPDRYRNEDGQVVDGRANKVLHDQNSDRTLLSTRAHNRLVRFRGYRILHRGGRAAYGATVGLPANVRRARSGGAQVAQDARQQRRVWGNTVREDVRAWGDTRRRVSQVLRTRTGDSGGSGPFTGRRLPATQTPAPTSGSASRTVTPAAPSAAPTPTGSGSGAAAAAAASGSGPASSVRRSSAARPPVSSQPQGPVLPGVGRARSATREEAAARMQELMRRTAPEAERIRLRREQQQARRQGRDEDE